MLLSYLREYPCKHENLNSQHNRSKMMRFVREILNIMNACERFYERFYDPSFVLQMIQMLKNACEYHCESYEWVSNETRMQNMGT